jgi:hypothetical protein
MQDKQTSRPNVPNPTIGAYDFRWNKLYSKPLDQIDGMACGVREDFASGKYNVGGFAGNLCSSPASDKVCFWVLEA